MSGAGIVGLYSVLAASAAGPVNVLFYFEGVDLGDGSVIRNQVLEAISKVTGATPWVIPELGAAPPAERIELRLFGGPTLIRIAAERFQTNRSAATANLDLERGPELRSREILTLIETLYPHGSEMKPVVPPTSSAPVGSPPKLEHEAGSILPWLLVGAGAAFGGVGAAFGVSSRNAGEEIASGDPRADELRALSDRQAAHAMVANVLFASAVVSLVTGFILRATE